MLVTSAQMRELDRRTIELGTPGITLMERAGAGIAAYLRAHHRAACRRGVLLLCGRGNNGGDGFVVARLLAKRGRRCTVVLLGRRAALSGDARSNADRWVRAHGRLIEIDELDGDAAALLERELRRAGVVVDGIFGTGLTRPVEGLAAAVIEAVNRAASPASSTAAREGTRRRAADAVKKKTAPPPAVVAIDVPSGLDSDSGEPLGVAIRAHATVTLGALKPGLILPAARAYVGLVELVDIGLAADALHATGPFGTAGDVTTLAPLLRRRAPGAHKGTNGHLLIVAGSLGKSGAALLCGRAALRGGAGLVTVACPEDTLPMIAAGLPELMTDPTGAFVAHDWQRRLDGKAAVVVGPGLGQTPEAVELVRWLASSAALPMVIDADGLNAIAGQLDVLRAAPAPRVLTPHPGEMARLTGLATKQVQADRIAHARTLARETGQVVVLKGSGTIVAAPDGRWSLNTSGGPILGTGGTGDVLAGLAGSLLAQGLDPYDAARVATFLHGRAGDRLALHLGDAGLLASELADELPQARRELVATPLARTAD
jgi:hydroxyethylthiazole kinase-like uncharacterized protein yjeF